MRDGKEDAGRRAQETLAHLRSRCHTTVDHELSLDEGRALYFQMRTSTVWMRVAPFAFHILSLKQYSLERVAPPTFHILFLIENPTKNSVIKRKTIKIQIKTDSKTAPVIEL